MKKRYKNIVFAAVALVAGLFTSCSMEEPFSEEKGNGSLTLITQINGDTQTRAAIDASTMSSLRKNAVIYVERKNSNAGRHDVIRKYFGLDQIPSTISLQKGNSYLAEGWTGDSVSASFDAKFYRGKTEEFRVEDQTMVALKLNIANVLVSFAPETFDLGLTDLEMKVSHSRGELLFSDKAEGGSTLYNTGYFMMPSADKSLKYTITAKNSSGETITRSGEIPNVQRAYEYQVRLKANDSPQWGGGLIKVEIAEIPVIDERIDILGKPAIEGIEFDLDEQVVGTPGNFNEKIVSISGYISLDEVSLGGDDAPQALKDILDNAGGGDLTNSSTGAGLRSQLENIGIHIENNPDNFDAASGVKYSTYTLYFKKEFFDNLPLSETEYVIYIYARDVNEKYNYATLRIANTESAVEVLAPVETVKMPDVNKEPMAVLAHRATVIGYLYNPDAADYGIEYREAGASEWIKVSAKNQSSARRKLRSMSRMEMATRAEKATYTINLDGLKTGTTYEYRAYSDDYRKSAVMTFTTESEYKIVNSSFEDWSTYGKNIIYPGIGGRDENPFWESGNEGAAVASQVLTDKSTEMVHSGQYSARLQSKVVMTIKLAAGNIFTGSFVGVDGTDGILSLGRPYNNSHPSKLKVWANYRPGSTIKMQSGNESFVPADFSKGNDHGQIYVALTTEPVEIRTKPANRKVFNPDEDCVLAYGEKTFTTNFGPDGQLEAVEIPITYNDRAKTNRPLYLIIVVAASKYGDYYCGADGSVFYLDDFELIYE